MFSTARPTQAETPEPVPSTARETKVGKILSIILDVLEWDVDPVVSCGFIFCWHRRYHKKKTFIWTFDNPRILKAPTIICWLMNDTVGHEDKPHKEPSLASQRGDFSCINPRSFSCAQLNDSGFSYVSQDGGRFV